MSKPVFPIGTKIRCVQSVSSGGQLIKGGEYFVEDVLPSSGNVRLLGVSDTYWQPTRFVLVRDVIRVNARQGLVKRVLNWLRRIKE